MAQISQSTTVKVLEYTDLPRALGKNVWDAIKIPPSQLKSQYLCYAFNQTTGEILGVVFVRKDVTNAYSVNTTSGVTVST